MIASATSKASDRRKRIRLGDLPQSERFDHTTANAAGNFQAMVALIPAESFAGGVAKISIDRAVVVSFAGQGALDLAHARAGVVFRLVGVGRRRILTRSIAIVVIGSVIVTVRIGTVTIRVRIPEERRVNHPEVIMKMATPPVPPMIAATIPVPLPVGALPGDYALPVIAESRGPSYRGAPRRQPRRRPRGSPRVEGGRPVTGRTGSIYGIG